MVEGSFAEALSAAAVQNELRPHTLALAETGVKENR